MSEKRCYDCAYKREEICDFHKENCQVHMHFEAGVCADFKEKSERQKAAEKTRYCRDCKYCEAPNGKSWWEGGGLIDFHNFFCRIYHEPVFGNEIKCEAARGDERRCGFCGNGWEYKGDE